MERIFQLENGTKWAFYENTNTLFLQLLPLPQSTMAKPITLAEDYLHSPTCTLFAQNLYYAYHSLSHTLKLGIAGNDTSTIILSDPENLSDCRQLTLFSFQSTLYICYLCRQGTLSDSTSSDTANLYCLNIMDVLHERLPYTVITDCPPTATYQLIHLTNSIGILLSDKKLSSHKYYQSTDILSFLPMYISSSPISNNTDIETMQQEATITEYQKQIALLKEEYRTLFSLCEQLQQEGKHWREKYYAKK